MHRFNSKSRFRLGVFTVVLHKRNGLYPSFSVKVVESGLLLLMITAMVCRCEVSEVTAADRSGTFAQLDSMRG